MAESRGDIVGRSSVRNGGGTPSNAYGASSSSASDKGKSGSGGSSRSSNSGGGSGNKRSGGAGKNPWKPVPASASLLLHHFVAAAAAAAAAPAPLTPPHREPARHLARASVPSAGHGSAGVVGRHGRGGREGGKGRGDAQGRGDSGGRASVRGRGGEGAGECNVRSEGSGNARLGLGTAAAGASMDTAARRGEERAGGAGGARAAGQAVMAGVAGGASGRVLVNPATSESIAARRGKEREVPKKKRVSRVKRLVLQARGQGDGEAETKGEAEGGEGDGKADREGRDGERKGQEKGEGETQGLGETRGQVEGKCVRQGEGEVRRLEGAEAGRQGDGRAWKDEEVWDGEEAGECEGGEGVNEVANREDEKWEIVKWILEEGKEGDGSVCETRTSIGSGAELRGGGVDGVGVSEGDLGGTVARDTSHERRADSEVREGFRESGGDGVREVEVGRLGEGHGDGRVSTEGVEEKDGKGRTGERRRDRGREQQRGGRREEQGAGQVEDQAEVQGGEQREGHAKMKNEKIEGKRPEREQGRVVKTKGDEVGRRLEGGTEEDGSKEEGKEKQDSSSLHVIVLGGPQPVALSGDDASNRYPRQLVTPQLNSLVAELLTELQRFQMRAFERDSIKGAMRRRLLSGLKEVGQAVRTGRAKCVVVAPDVEAVPGAGGLDSCLTTILSDAAARSIPVVVALTRRRLAQVLGRRRCRMSAVAILDSDGAHSMLKSVLGEAERCREMWRATGGEVA